MKTGYDVRTGVLVPAADCEYIRTHLMGLESGQDDDPISGQMSDVAFAAILRWCWVKHLLNHPDIALRCLAAGLVGAARTLAAWRGWNPSLMRWQAQGARFDSWGSAVVKCAGAHLQKETGNVEGSWHNRMYTFVWSCVTECLTSTVSDDSGLRRRHIADLKDEGLLVRPTPKQWQSAIEPIELLLAGNQFGGVHKPVLRYRQQNGRYGEQPLAPARTMALLCYASSRLDAECKALLYQSDFMRTVRNIYGMFQSERQRFAVWACGNSPDIHSQMRCFDIRVAATCDLLPQGPGGDGALYGNVVAQDYRISVLNADGERIVMAAPPWREQSVEIPSVVDKRVGIFAGR